MKTKFFTLVAVAALTISTGFKATAATTTIDDRNAIVLSEAANFSKIEVRGNVELFISDGATNQVKVYNQYYSESALVQNHNGTLRIASYKNEKLVVWITVNDLRSLNIYDNAEVKSFGKLSAINMDVNLYDNASAKLDVNMFAASISINDRAKANLTGDVKECYLTHDRSAYVNSAALSTDKLVLNNVAHVAPKGQELAGL
jgi:hypothetical protein